PSREEAARLIEGRAPEGRRASINVRRHGTRFRGQVDLGDGEERITRSVEAASCLAVLDALVLVISLDVQRDPAQKGETAELPSKPAASPVSAPMETSDATAARPTEGTSAREISVGAAGGVLSLIGTPASFGGVMVELAATRPWLGSSWLR